MMQEMFIQEVARLLCIGVVVAFFIYVLGGYDR